jgi:hypothetical protein
MEIAQTLHVRKVRCECRYIPLWAAENWPPRRYVFIQSASLLNVAADDYFGTVQLKTHDEVLWSNTSGLSKPDASLAKGLKIHYEVLNSEYGLSRVPSPALRTTSWAREAAL